MNIKQFRDKLLHNWQAKVICLVIAVIVYFFHQISGYVKESFVLPLNVDGESIMAPSEQMHVQNIKLSVRGKTEDIQRLDADNFYAYVDISSVTKAGKNKLPVLIRADESVTGLESVEITTKPEYVEILFDERYERYVQLLAEVKGVPAQSYDYNITSITPSTVKVSGPKTLVQNLKYIKTEDIDVDRRNSDFQQTVSLVNKNNLLKLEKLEDGSKPQALVKIHIYENKTTKLFAGIKANFRNVSEGFVAETENLYFDVNLEGSVSQIEKMESSEIQLYLDLAEFAEEGEQVLDVKNILPKGVVLKSVSPARVNVKIRKLSEEEIKAQEAVNGQESNPAEEKKSENNNAAEEENPVEEQPLFEEPLLDPALLEGTTEEKVLEKEDKI